MKIMLAIALALFPSSVVFAEEANPAHLDAIVVDGRAEELLGSADTSSEGSTGQQELSRLAFARPGELMETVPGLIITQHDGGGKANQYYLRGFNLDHGTDLATYVDGVPLNLPTHAHGQGYTDTNWMIPEIVRDVRFKKGPYFAEYGDYANAGEVSIDLVETLTRAIFSVEGGNYGYARTFIAASPVFLNGHLLYALEISHFDGAWDVKDDYRKFNGVLKYSTGAETGKDGTGSSIAFQGYDGHWVGTDQVPERAIDSGLIGRYGSLDPNVGGATNRYSLYGNWHRQSADSRTLLTAYAVKYGLDLFSNFSYFIDQTSGDEIKQRDRRNIIGLSAKHSFDSTLGSLPTEHSIGLDIRNDDAEVELAHASNQVVTSVVRDDHVKLLNVGPWASNKTQWTDWFRTTVGVRADIFSLSDDSGQPINSGNMTAAALSPKTSFVFGPFNKTEIYASAGTGLRSVDARSVFLTSDPGGGPSKQLPPIVKTRGGEIGVRNSSIAGLKTSLAYWILESDSETYFSSDSGTVEDSGQKGRRTGLEWTNFYQLNQWLDVDADFSVSQARFDQVAPGEQGDHIPEAITSSAATSVTIHDGPLCEGCFVSARVRYFGSRDLTTDGSQVSAPSTVVNLASGFPVAKNYSFKVEVLNLFDAKYNDAEYYDVSRLKGETLPAGVTDGISDHLVHAGEPLSFRIGLTGSF